MSGRKWVVGLDSWGGGGRINKRMGKENNFNQSRNGENQYPSPWEDALQEVAPMIRLGQVGEMAVLSSDQPGE